MASDSTQHGTPAWEKMTDIPVGEILRRARVHYSLSLDDVAAALHIRAGQLGALEESRPELLPGRVYAIGFVRAYAEYLGLDGDKMVHLFKAQSVGGRTRPELSLPAHSSESKAPGMLVLMTSLIMLGSGMMGMAVFNKSHDKGPVPIPSVPVAVEGNVQKMASEAPLTTALTKAIQQTKTEVSTAPPPPPPSRITVKAADSAWLEIRDAQGKVLLSRILKADDSYDVPDQPGMTLDTGDAGALAFTVDGADVPPLGAKGDVLRNVTLDPTTLKNPPPPGTVQQNTKPSKKSKKKPKP